MKLRQLKYFPLLALLFAAGCTSPKKDSTPVAEESHAFVVLISKDNNGHIADWMRTLDDDIRIKVCYGMSNDSLDHYLSHADAIIIGGGEDVNPSLYNKPEYAEICGDFDLYRDSLEVKMIHYADDKNVPIMGICRGQQIMNVVHGGTLIPDIPTYISDSISHQSEKDSAHVIFPVGGSWMSTHFSQERFWVNSRHHQSIGILAEGFQVAAYASDSVIEATYLDKSSSHPFTMAVQFHPENLRDSLSNQFGRMLLNSMEQHR